MSRNFRKIDQNSTHPASVNAKMAFVCEEIEELKKLVKNMTNKFEWIESYLEKQNGFERWEE